MLVADVLSGLMLHKAAGWDPVGLQLGDREAAANQVGVCHEVTDRVLAASEGLDLLVSYHPLLFKPLNRLTAGTGPSGRAYQLVRKGISLAVVHTAWDAVPGGAADALAAAVGLTGVRPFGLVDASRTQKLVTFVPTTAVEKVVAALVEAGAGSIGKYRGCSFRSAGMGSFLPEVGANPTIGHVGEATEVPEVRVEIVLAPGIAGQVVAALLASHPYEEPAFDLIDTVSNAGQIGRCGAFKGNFEELAERLRSAFGADLRVAAPLHPRTERVAVLPGSGGSFVAEAAASGAGAFVTGDLNHHHMVEALDLGMGAIDIGHAASERPGVKALLSLVGTMVTDVVDLTFDPTPWRGRS